MQRAILFLKAAIAGGAHGDLFTQPVQVAGHTRGAAYVAPHTALRRKRAAEPQYPDNAPPDVQAAFYHRRGVAKRSRRPDAPEWPDAAHPDEAHARLYRLGIAHRAGRQVDPAEVRALFDHFNGWLEDDRDGGRPFHLQEHVLETANEYAQEVQDGGPGSIIDPDRAAEYWHRAAQHWRAQAARGG
jgi:hypothetical protein